MMVVSVEETLDEGVRWLGCKGWTRLSMNRIFIFIAFPFNVRDAAELSGFSAYR